MNMDIAATSQTPAPIRIRAFFDKYGIFVVVLLMMTALFALRLWPVFPGSS